MNLKLDFCSHDAAKYACENWHYSRKMPLSKTVRIGVWEDEKFIGAVIFSCGSAGVGSMYISYKMPQMSIAELARVALTKHKTPVSRIVSLSIKILRKVQPKLKMIVSYADPRQGHIGAIYQAGNWIYTGRSSKDFAYIDKQGRRWHSRLVAESGFKKVFESRVPCPKPSEMTKIVLEPKFKYFMPLDEETRIKMAKLAKPYPKNACEVIRDTSAYPAEKGGSTPTHTLSKEKKKFVDPKRVVV